MASWSDSGHNDPRNSTLGLVLYTNDVLVSIILACVVVLVIVFVLGIGNS